MPQIKAGNLRPLAITPFPSSLLPGEPAMKDLGGEPPTKTYFGVFAPARTPKVVVEKLSSEFAKALKEPKIQQNFEAQTLTPVDNTPDEFAAFLIEDRAGVGSCSGRWALIQKNFSTLSVVR